MALNQTCHTRPILPTYEQAVGASFNSQPYLRLPDYRDNYLARYSPYMRYSYHPRFDCNDEVPAYDDDATAPAGPPTRRPLLPLAPQPEDPDHRERVKDSIQGFFDCLAALFAPKDDSEENPNQV